MPDFDTGPATLPDVGELSYNGCVFSPLFETNVSGVVVKDAANRTTKYMEYTITADGYVTLPDDDTFFDGEAVPDTVMSKLKDLLTAQAGALVYKGRGNDIVVNKAGGAVQDVAWGPIPEVLDFQPLGGGRAAKIRWQVKTRIPQIVGKGGRLGPVLQFNEETSVTYDDAGFSTLAIRGTLEIPLTRATQNSRTVDITVDAYRQSFLQQIADGIDLKRFRIVRREFNVSRDKRTMEWDFGAEELPYMGLPPAVTIARGSFNFRPSKQGVGLCNWLCTLRVTYTVRKDRPRRVAYDAFLALLRIRMLQSQNGVIPPPGSNQNPGNAASGLLNSVAVVAAPLFPVPAFLGASLRQQAVGAPSTRKAWLIDFSGDEGLYLDSRTMTFSATWRLVTTFSAILKASGLWKKVPSDGGETWATSVSDVSGWTSWLSNRLDASQDVIVDFGGGG